MSSLSALLAGLLANTHVKSFLLGASGALTTYMLEWVAATDFGTLTPLIAAGVPVLVNAIHKSAQDWLQKPADPPVDLTPLLVLAIVCGLGGAVAAAPPRAVIQGNEAGVSGEILILDASLSEGEPTHFRWSISPEIDGRRQIIAGDGGDLAEQTAKRIQVATIPGNYVVRLIVSNGQGNDDAYRLVSIPGTPPAPIPVPLPTPRPVTPQPDPQPQPTPTPEPQPAPRPTFPAGRFGMAQGAYDVAMSVSSATRAAEAKCLAEACRGLSQRLEKEQLGANAIVQAMAKALDGCTSAAWDVARLSLTARISELYSARQLRSTADWKNLVDEVAAGLDAVR